MECRMNVAMRWQLQGVSNQTSSSNDFERSKISFGQLRIEAVSYCGLSIRLDLHKNEIPQIESNVHLFLIIILLVYEVLCLV